MCENFVVVRGVNVNVRVNFRWLQVFKLLQCEILL